MFGPEKHYWKGRLSTVDLLVQSRFNQALFIFKLLLAFITKQAFLMRRSSVLSFPLKLVFPAWTVPLSWPHVQIWIHKLPFFTTGWQHGFRKCLVTFNFVKKLKFGNNSTINEASKKIWIPRILEIFWSNFWWI